MNKEVMSERMRGLREDHDYTQKYVAYKLGIDQRAYSTYETGKREMPVHKLYMLCELYGVSMDYMVGRSAKRIWNADRAGSGVFERKEAPLFFYGE
ncbi:MAG: helix-turn-helix domain-containing protein [Lachnospiraceae bacterium]